MREDVLDLLLVLSAMIRNESCVPGAVKDAYRTHVIAHTQYLRLPDPIDQTEELRTLMRIVRASVDFMVWPAVKVG